MSRKDRIPPSKRKHSDDDPWSFENSIIGVAQFAVSVRKGLNDPPAIIREKIIEAFKDVLTGDGGTDTVEQAGTGGGDCGVIQHGIR